MKASIRDLAVLGVIGMVAVWLAASGSSGPDPVTAPGIAASEALQAPAVARSLTQEAEGLWQRLRTAPAPLPAGRNPFAFAPAPVERVTLRPAAPPAAAPVRAMAPVSPVPDVRLVGVAENETADGPLRTAILSASGQLFLVKVGDPVGNQAGDDATPRFTVTAIGPDVVELLDSVRNEPLRLALQ